MRTRVLGGILWLRLAASDSGFRSFKDMNMQDIITRLANPTALASLFVRLIIGKVRYRAGQSCVRILGHVTTPRAVAVSTDRDRGRPEHRVKRRTQAIRGPSYEVMIASSPS